MIRILVVDDERLARSGVCTRLTNHADLEVIGECSDGETALAAIVVQEPDLVFMDVQMPGMSGIDVLGQLSPQKRPMAVLLTAYDHFAIRAFEIHALDYLLKPIDDERFAEALDRARQALVLHRHGLHTGGIDGLLAARSGSPAYASRFTVRIGHRITFVDAAEIDWIEAAGDYAGLHVSGKVHLVREPLHQLVRRLDPARFVRIHRSTIVCIERVTELEALSNRDSLLRLTDGTPLRASRTYVDDLRAALAATCMGGD
jgi:two-component system, LytTR family, response regulator